MPRDRERLRRLMTQYIPDDPSFNQDNNSPTQSNNSNITADPSSPSSSSSISSNSSTSSGRSSVALDSLSPSRSSSITAGSLRSGRNFRIPADSLPLSPNHQLPPEANAEIESTTVVPATKTDPVSSNGAVTSGEANVELTILPTQTDEESRDQGTPEETTTTKRRTLDITVVAAETPAQKTLFWNIVLIMFALGMTWLLFWVLFWHLSNFVNGIVNVGARCWSFLTMICIAAFDTLIYVITSVMGFSGSACQWIVDTSGSRGVLKRAVVSTLGDGVLCASPITLWFASWLHISCPSLDMTMMSGTLDEAVHELDGWAEISELLSPHSHAIQLATIPLEATQVRLHRSRFNLTEKDSLVESLGLYINGLFLSADCMYDVALATSHLLMVLVYNLQDVQVLGPEVTKNSKYWWLTGNTHRYNFIAKTLPSLIDVFDREIFNLVATLNPCILTLRDTHNFGSDCTGFADRCRESIDAQLKTERSFQSNGPSLLSLKKLVSGFILLDTQSILLYLTATRDRLEVHRTKLQRMKAALSMSYDLTELNGLQQFLEVLHESHERLSTAKLKFALAAARERAEYERQAKEGFFTDPPNFPTTSSATSVTTTQSPITSPTTDHSG